ncbi:MAG: zf-HC2 domain-containing protein [Phycisphaeraceae bacterium]|nr:zf-HC2 domain-containing protein [Phycisphaeraceae bacterium]
MSQSDYITCRELIDFISDYLESRLPAEQLREFERHLAVCPSCVNYLDAYRKTIVLGRAALEPSDDSARGSAPEGLLKAIKATRRNMVS